MRISPNTDEKSDAEDARYSDLKISGNDGEDVTISLTDVDGDYAFVSLTPEQAREAGTRLYQAAFLADPNMSHRFPRADW